MTSPLTPRLAILGKYWKLFDLGLQNTFVYRWNFLLRMVFGIVPLIGAVFLWQAVFRGREGGIEGYDFPAMIFYFLLVVFLENLITPTEDEWQIAAEIRDGRISAYLTKPLNYLAYRFCTYASYRLLYFGVVLVPILILAYVFRAYIVLPANVLTWPAFLISTIMAALIQFLMAYSLALISFWVLEVSTIIFIHYAFEYFLSGQVFPLDMMPRWLQGFLLWSPFTYELFFPVQIAMERVHGAALVRGLAIQAGWVLLMWLCAHWLWARGIRKYQAVGG